MADLFTVSLQALLRETATSIPEWSVTEWPQGSLTPTQNFKMSITAGPGAITVPLNGFVLVQYLAIQGIETGVSYNLTYKDNANNTHTILCASGFPVAVTSVSPSLSLTILPFGGATIHIRIMAVGV